MLERDQAESGPSPIIRLRSEGLPDEGSPLHAVNLQRTGELHDIFNPEVSFATFDPTNVCGVRVLFRIDAIQRHRRWVKEFGAGLYVCQFVFWQYG
jgi:hypothetical protein